MSIAGPFTFPLVDDSGLDLTQNSLRVLGFSVASQLFLQPDTATTLKWAPFPTALTTPAALTSGVNTLTWAGGLPLFTAVSVGAQVSGTGIPTGTTVTGISVTVTLSNAATGTITAPLTIGAQVMVGGTATLGSATITGLAPPPSTSNLRIGQLVSGSGIPAGATLSAINSASQITLSANATANASYSGASALTFSVQLSGALTSASTSATFSGLNSTSQLAVGGAVTGATQLPSGTLISSIDSVTLTLSNAATASGTNDVTFTQAQTGTLSSGSASVTGLTSTSNLGIGYPITGPGIPAGTTITQINSSSAMTLSNPVTGSGSQTLLLPPPSGIIPSFDIHQYTSFGFDPSTQTAGLNGARIYFFVVPSDWPATATQAGMTGFPINPPGFPYAWSATGFGVMQPNNPPNSPLFNSSYPPFAISEPTIDSASAGGNLHIDVQTVDGFTFPLSLTLQDANNNPLGQVGQPVPSNGVDRAGIIGAFKAAFPSGNAYSVLLYGNAKDINGQYPGILNPGAYLADSKNSQSPLNSLWDTTLTTLFTNITSLNMIGDDQAWYQGKPATVGASNVLEFIGYTDTAMTQSNGNKFHIYSPLTPDTSAPNIQLGAGYQVFANDGVFNDSSVNVLIEQNVSTSPTPVQVALGLQRDIVSALNRGIALAAPTGSTNRTAGDTSYYWGTESNWYPLELSDTGTSQVQNQFSLFMHTAQVSVPNVGNVPIFTQPPAPVATPKNLVMGQAYGFAFDESPVHAPSNLQNQPTVPSKFDPTPAGTSVVTLTLGPWGKGQT
ncbi:hypothetical protein JY651_27580 [Pyxidicoccus parkwayensis]|uniref:Uncharacterized protein n=1 Tax=Pyxidicoccus parkwayensis TaxID=2813578 RepID=A0ABX7NL15_9BACT|nr:hypothetical protein [Pyxidicoccus parkwaysis]QSQ19108.1 hypothetical protein JY651_27580 [Pyxidicoccus parkwaysis]